MSNLNIVEGTTDIKIRVKEENNRYHYESKKALVEIGFNDFRIYILKGSKSEFDILIKYKGKLSSIRTPKHIHWVVDILLKQSKERKLTNDFLLLLQKCWQECKPLTNNDFETICTFISNQWQLLDYSKYEILNEYGEYPVNFLFVLMNLLSVQEKTNRKDAYMFGKIIDKLLEDELDIFSIVSAAGFGGIKNGK